MVRKPLVFIGLVALALAATLLVARPDLVALRAAVAQLADLRAAHPLALACALFAAYVLITALSLPLSVPMTLALGALFGFWRGLVLVSFAASLGATGAFLVARFLARDWAQARLGRWAARIEARVARDGAFALFSLRLVPVVPFFAVNLAFGLTAMRVALFYAVSQIGMLPGTAAYVWAGTQLGRVDSLSGVLSPGLIGAFALLAVLPWLMRSGSRLVAARRRARRWPRPARFEADLVVIGGGAAGLVASYVAAAAQAKVVLIAEGPMGGDCLNFGCVPSKALIAAARAAAGARAAEGLGANASVEVDFPAVMAHVRATIATIAPKDSEERYRALGIEVIRGRAQLLDPFTVAVGARRITTRTIVLATGAAPVIPPVPGLAEAALTTETVWDWLATRPEAPEALVILGGGPVGCELAQALARLGAGVTLIEAADRLIAREEPEASALLHAALVRDGVRVFTDTTLARVEPGKAVLADGREIPCAAILAATGRRLRAEGLGLEALGIATDRVIAANDFLQTAQPNIFVAGDAAGPRALTSAAGHQGWIAAMNALATPFWRFDARAAIPAAIFTEPEIARIGLTEAEARAEGIAVEITRWPLADLDRAVAEGRTEGFVQVLTAKGGDRILGATVAGAQAGEILGEFALAMRHGLGLSKILATPHLYPGWTEAAKATAGRWRAARVNPRLLALAARFHRWRRG